MKKEAWETAKKASYGSEANGFTARQRRTNRSNKRLIERILSFLGPTTKKRKKEGMTKIYLECP
jgi:hypothetical protein